MESPARARLWVDIASLMLSPSGTTGALGLCWLCWEAAGLWWGHLA